MLALVVALGVVGAWGDVDEDAPRPKPAEERVEQARSDPETRARWSPGATKRFAGALLGGAVGALLPGVLGVATSAPCAPTCSIGSTSTAFFLLTPLSAAVGTLVGWSLAGGAVSVGAAAAGALAGMMAAIVLLLVPAATIARDRPDLEWPLIIGLTGLAVGLETLALDARQTALEETPALATPVGRFLATSLTMLGAVVVGTVGVTALMAATQSTTVLVASALVAVSLAPLAPWAVHRALGGRGAVGWAYVGMLATNALVVGSVLAGAVSSIGGAFGLRHDARLDAALVLAFSAGAFAGVFGVPLMLEYAHGRALLETAQGPAATLSVAPIAGGAMAGVTVQF